LTKKKLERFLALAGINPQCGLTSHRGEQIKTLEAGDGRIELRAVTGPPAHQAGGNRASAPPWLGEWRARVAETQGL
jgi:hypothetical protein